MNQSSDKLEPQHLGENFDNKNFIEGYAIVADTNLEYEAELIRTALEDHGIPTIIYNQKDHAYILGFGHMSVIKILVKAEDYEKAYELIGKLEEGSQELADDMTFTEEDN